MFFQVAKKLREKIIKTNKPCFLELSTYRHYEHCGPNFDDDLGYRNPKVTEKWKKKCPIRFFNPNIQFMKKILLKLNPKQSRE